jgi:hypothetical protein
MKRGSVHDGDGSEALERARRALEAWRSEGRAGRRIPEALWGAVVEAARVHGVSRTSRALGVGYRELKRRFEAKPHTPPAFAELAVPAWAPVAECVLEREDGRGGRVRVELRGAGLASAASLARALWGAGR